MTPQDKAKHGHFMSLCELAEVVGMDRKRLALAAKKPGFPLFLKKVRLSDFNSWLAEEIGSRRESVSGHPLPAVDKSDVPMRSRGLRQVSPHAQVRRYAQVGK